MKHRIHRRHVDQLVDAYVDWREACVRVTEAYRRWTSAAEPGATIAFTRYRVALDYEERAADVYASLVRRVSLLLTIDSSRSMALKG